MQGKYPRNLIILSDMNEFSGNIGKEISTDIKLLKNIKYIEQNLAKVLIKKIRYYNIRGNKL